MGPRSGCMRKLSSLFSYISKPNAAPALTVSQTKRITEYGRSGEVAKAMEMFEQMPQRNQVSWNAMLSVLLETGQLDSALRLFDEMPQRNSTSYTSMITGLSKSGFVSKARKLFDSIPSSDQNVFSWTAMISCYVQNAEPLQAIRIFSSLYGKFFELKIVPNSHTFSVLLKSCGCIQSLAAGRQINSLIVKLLDEYGENSIFVHNCLIDLYAKLGNLADAEGVFYRMKWKDMGSWNTMMDGYTHHLLIDKALGIFNSMKEKDVLSWNIVMLGLMESRQGEQALRFFLCLLRSGQDMKPNSSTYTIVLTVSSTLTMLELGRQIHARIVKIGFYQTNIFVSNSLITMYACCGLNEEAEQVFNEMTKKDVVSWNSVIQGLGQNGCARKALEIAEKALGSKNYNHNTFTALLTSCSHGGLVDEGLSYFSAMSGKYGIEPSLDHYICVVDMLGRAGKIQASHNLLRSMPFAATSIAWATLLNSCLIHGNIDVGEIAAKELKVLEPGIVTSYVAMTSIYSKTGRIEESRRLLDLMREKDLRKEPGCSWVVES